MFSVVRKRSEPLIDRNSPTEPPPSILRRRSRLLRRRGSIETHHRSKPTTDQTPPPIETHQGPSSVFSVFSVFSRFDPPSSLVFFSARLRIETHQGGRPRTKTVSVLTASPRILFVLTASPPSLLVFSGRRTMQTHHRRRVLRSSRLLICRSFSSGSQSLQFGDDFPSNKLSHLIRLSVSL